jgi:hypothetical protein
VGGLDQERLRRVDEHLVVGHEHPDPQAALLVHDAAARERSRFEPLETFEVAQAQAEHLRVHVDHDRDRVTAEHRPPLSDRLDDRQRETRRDAHEAACLDARRSRSISSANSRV